MQDAPEPLHFTRVVESGKTVAIGGDVSVIAVLLANGKIRLDLTLFENKAVRVRANRLVGVRRKKPKGE